MAFTIKTVAFEGINTVSVDVQVLIAAGIPGFSIVGLPNKAVAESRDRIRAAFYSIGLALPPKRITINLAPADIVKEGSHYDLPIALGLMAALGVLSRGELSNYMALGELGLDGSIQSVNGVLPAAMHANGLNLGLICPQSNGAEAVWADEDLPVIASPNLLSICNHLKGTQILQRPRTQMKPHTHDALDLKDVRKQETAKRVMEIAAAGGHNILFSGPPGTGKSMLSERLLSLLPPLDAQDALEVTMIHSLAGLLEQGELIVQRPFRAPHHSASLVALTGGGFRVQPGEVSLAHCGVLFLDELPEFNRSVLEVLRQPLETGSITIARANAHITYPARFQLIAAMNPCRCGYLGEAERACSRAPRCGEDYISRISGPLLDRFDLFTEVATTSPGEFLEKPQGRSSADIRQKVEAARRFSRERQKMNGSEQKTTPNSQLPLDTPILEGSDNITDEAFKTLVTTAERFRLSGRGINRTLKVARTIADLAQEHKIENPHIIEALSYRRRFEFS